MGSSFKYFSSNNGLTRKNSFCQDSQGITWIMEDKLEGEGAFGSVRRCKSQDNKNQAVVKKQNISDFVKKNKGNKGGVLEKLNLEAKINHTHHGVGEIDIQTDYSYTLMKALPPNAYETFFDEKREKHYQFTTFQDFLNFYISILHEVKNLHEQGYLHRDIKFENICVDILTNKVYLCDFGLSKTYDKKKTANDKSFSVPVSEQNHQAPEYLLGNQPPHPAVDIYSLGKLLLGLTQKKKKEAFHFKGDIFGKTRFDENFIKKMVDPIPLNRPSLDEVIQYCTELAIKREKEQAKKTSPDTMPKDLEEKKLAEYPSAHGQPQPKVTPLATNSSHPKPQASLEETKSEEKRAVQFALEKNTFFEPQAIFYDETSDETSEQPLSNELLQLKNAIRNFESYQIKSTEHQDFLDSLNHLYKKLEEDNTPEANHVAITTARMLYRLQQSNNAEIEQVINDYKEKCQSGPGWKKFARAIGAVILAVISYTLVGAAAGLLLGALSGPGMIGTCIAGALGGAIKGVTYGAITFGVVSGGASYLGMGRLPFFKSNTAYNDQIESVRENALRFANSI